MAKRTILRVLTALLSIPFIAFSGVVEAFGLWKFRADLAVCVETVDRNKSLRLLPSAFLQILVAAEDRRNAEHVGVDPIGMIRAALSLITGNALQGASTIEQQFVRVVTNRYEQTLFRKIREQALAIALSRRRRKKEISNAYLCVAFYGQGLVGLPALIKLCGETLETCPPKKICEAIARLKYPQPLSPSYRWYRTLDRRVAYISRNLHARSGQSVVSRNAISFVPMRAIPRAKMARPSSASPLNV